MRKRTRKKETKMAFKGKDKGTPDAVENKSASPVKSKIEVAKFSCSVCGYTRKNNDMSSTKGVCIACAALNPKADEVK